jgi:cobalt-zinc-cadmium resistance protein CzcA
MDQNSVTDLEKLYQIPVNLPDGSSVLLSELIELKNIQGPNQISRENGKRRIVITQTCVVLISVVTLLMHNQN